MKTFRKYLITLIAGLAAVAAIVWVKDIFAQTEPAAVCHILCDAFFVVGWVTFAAGALVFTSNEGAFDMLSYGMSSFLDLFREKSRKKFHTYFDYKQSKAEKKFSFGFLLICGLLFLAISLVLLPLCS